MKAVLINIWETDNSKNRKIQHYSRNVKMHTMIPSLTSNSTSTVQPNVGFWVCLLHKDPSES